jgi:tetratricopeptide (TPR) repeat protein
MSSVPRVFVSATSRDLASYRRAVADALRSIGALAVIQEDFPPDYRSVMEVLRHRIAGCDAVICLIGRIYGSEPAVRTADEPRRSYTQLEYQIANDLHKPVFVFVARDDCPVDHPDDPPEADELRGLQLEYLKRLAASNRLRTPFRSADDLAWQVRGMRFDPESLAKGFTSRLVAIMTAELLDVAEVRERQGEMAWAQHVVKPSQELVGTVMTRWNGVLQSESPAQWQINFDTADAAVNAALDLHVTFDGRPWPDGIGTPRLRVGIHVAQIVRFGGLDESRVLQAGPAVTLCRQLTELALPGQTLLTRTAFDIAREYVRHAPASSAGPDGDAGISELRWCAHGRYKLSAAKAEEEDLDIFEVGVEGRAPLAAPADSPLARRAGSLEERQMEGWRPGVRQAIPRQPGWIIERKLGEGGFGEVWVAYNSQLRERRVFKFCFDAARLSSFKRELTLFKLLREALGDRPDIARLLDVRLDVPPYYLESEFVGGGNLRDWSADGKRLIELPLDERLRLLAEIARAVAAAHSVGVIHKDLKPSNVFMRKDIVGKWHPILADFGIGAVADRAELQKRGITAAGFTESLLEPGSSRTGTRMYQPPEASAGRPAMMQADVFALGVLFYQMVLGDFDTPFGEGWEDELRSAWMRMGLDPDRDRRFRLLCGDIRSCVDKNPARRLATAAQVVERIETLDARVAAEEARHRAEREAAEAEERADREAAKARERARRIRSLRRALAGVLVVLVLVAGLGVFAYYEKQAADAARTIAVQKERLANESARRAELSAQESITQRKAAEAASRQNQALQEHFRAVLKDLPAGSAAWYQLRNMTMTQETYIERHWAMSPEPVPVDRDTAVARTERGDGVLPSGAASSPRMNLRSYSNTLHLLGKAQVHAGQLKEARQSFEDAIVADPSGAIPHDALAWFLATSWDVEIRDGKRAVGLAMKACELTQWKLPVYVSTLAAAHAEAGRFDEAVKWQRKALETPDAFGADLEPAKARLRLYESGKPYHHSRETPAAPPQDPPREPANP